MTYCLALRLDEGLVFLADTRTNAGLDNVGTYRKLHVIQPLPDRIFVLESAGNLATTQEVLDRIQADLDSSGEHESLATVKYLFEAALYIGKLNYEVSQRHKEALSSSGADATATFILGGEIRGDKPDILMVYPEGNYISASEERPFLQIGESKYGKFMLEFAAKSHADIEKSAKIALSSMLSTARANLSVGPPYDLGVYRNGTLSLEEFRFNKDSKLLVEMEKLWANQMMEAVAELPPMSVEELHEQTKVADSSE